MFRRLLPIAFAAGVAGCAPIDSMVDKFGRTFVEGAPATRSFDGTLPSVQAPVLRNLRSFETKDLTSGQITQLRVERFGNGIRVREPDGCAWTRAGSWFAPSDSFARCGSSTNWHTGSARIRREGSLFPMQVGATATYHRRAVSWNGRVSERSTRCAVTGTREVVRPSGQGTPTFVIVCDDGRVERTTWYAPAEGPVAYREAHHERGLREAWVRVD